MRIDLHTHSHHSDGTQSPRNLLLEAAEHGVDVVALTDHDTFAGWDEALSTGVEVGVDVVPGVEVSCLTSGGISVHLLAYLPDRRHAALADLLAQGRSDRDERARKMIDLLSEDYPVTWETVLENSEPGTVYGRPHVADALVAAGVVRDRSEAFGTLIHARSPYYVPHFAPLPQDAVRLVREAGGVPVFAHPRAVTRGRVVGEEVFEDMVAAGLAGLEVFHRDNPESERPWLMEFADRHGLFVTGSSDFHGRGKPNTIGENTTAPEVLEEIRRQGRGGR